MVRMVKKKATTMMAMNKALMSSNGNISRQSMPR